jgi:DNA-directed RNA polymerase III subunit RPC7
MKKKAQLFSRPETASHLTEEEKRQALQEKLKDLTEDADVDTDAERDEDEAEEERDYNYEEDEDEMGGDYNAETYFDGGDDEDEGDGDNDGHEYS